MIVILIILGIIAATSFFVLGVFVKEAKKEYNESSPGTRYHEGCLEKLNRLKLFRTVIPLGCILLVSLILVIGGVKILDSTEIGVVKTFGQISHTIDGGLNFVNPISDTVQIYDLKVHSRQASFASYTKDAQPIISTVELQYSIEPAYAMQIAQEYGSYEALEAKLSNIAEERAKVVFAKYSAMPLLENRANLSAEVTTEMQDLQEIFHIHFGPIAVKDIDFSDAFEASVEAKMTAEQEALRAEQEKKTAVIKAEQAAEVAKIQADQKVVEAEAEAKALGITREALENMPQSWITQMWIEKWNGKLPEYMLGDSTGIMISPSVE